MIELIDGRAQQSPVHIPRPRPVAPADGVEEVVRSIVEDVRLRGDDALIEHTARLNGATLDRADLRIDPGTVAAARSLVRPELIEAFEVAAHRLRATCERERPQSWIDRSGDEVVGELVRPLRRVGIHVPGGPAAGPSTITMAATPARAAGVEDIAVVSPPLPSGEVPEAVLAACTVAGIDEVYPIGGAQAVAALAYGTESVRPVDKIVGRGDLHMRLAAHLVTGWVGVGITSGATEIAVIAGDDAKAGAIAADLVAQAEHGPLGTYTLITWSPDMADAVTQRLDELVLRHERSDDVENALIEGGSAVLVRDLDHAIATANALAPEHLELAFEGAADVLDRITNAGAVLIGPASPAAAGDYVAGITHILPGGGAARFESGLGVNDFVKRIYVFGSGFETLARLAPHIQALAEAEGLHGHARSVMSRMNTAGDGR